MLKSTSAIALTCATLLLSGCATPAQVVDMSYTAEADKVANPTSNLYKAISLDSVEGGSETNPVFGTSQVSGADFQTALQNSLKDSNYLADNAGRYTLKADLVNLEQPLFGMDMTVRALVNYKLTEKATGKTLLSETIEAPHTATVGQKFLGVERLRLANEGAIKQNIKKLIDKLSSISSSPTVK